MCYFIIWLIGLGISFFVIGFKSERTFTQNRIRNLIAGVILLIFTVACREQFGESEPETFLSDYILLIGTILGGGFLVKGFDKKIVEK